MTHQVVGARSPTRRSGWSAYEQTDGRWRWRAWCNAQRQQGVVDNEGEAVELAQAAERALTGAV